MDFRRVTRSMTCDPGGVSKYGNFVKAGSLNDGGPGVPSLLGFYGYLYLVLP